MINVNIWLCVSWQFAKRVVFRFIYTIYLKSVEVNDNNSPFVVSCEIKFPLYLKFKFFPARDLTFRETNTSFFHSMDISKAPLPFIPETFPEESADGSAGRIS